MRHRPEPARLADAPLLVASGLAKEFRTEAGVVQAVRGVDLTMGRGEFVAVMGPSGSGKSTLLHLLGGLEPATKGQIWLDGRRVDQLGQAGWAVLRRHRIGFVFQFFNLVSNLTVADNVELPALMAGATRREARERRERLLADLGLSAKAGYAPARLSGGEQQRVALARALAHEPCLLFADEPTGNLDSSNSAEVMRLLGRCHARGQAILLVTHNARVASMADRVISLFDGMIADDASLRLPPVTPADVGQGAGAIAHSAVPGVLELRG